MLYSLENKTLWGFPKPKRIIEVWVDAGFSWKFNLNKEKKEGIIAYKIGKGKIIEKTIKVPAIEGLKQYTNLYELMAIATALETTKAKNVIIYTDSQIARGWAMKRTNDLGQFSPQHFATKERIDNKKKKLNYFDVRWISRNNNPVGIWLDERYRV